MIRRSPGSLGSVPIVRVARRSVADQLFDQLLGDILSGEHAAGGQLPSERELAVQAGVNRQAVREALQRLRQMDLVEIVHGGGIHVRDWRTSAGLALLPLLVVDGRTIDPDVALSIMELRTTIGADAARLCAQRGPDGTAVRLTVLVDRMEVIGSDPDLWDTLGFDFWGEVVDAAGNVAYRLALNTLRAVAGVVAPQLPPVLGVEWFQRDLYRAVVAAVAARDGEAAHRAARTLLGRGEEAVAAMVGRAVADPAVPDPAGP